MQEIPESDMTSINRSEIHLQRFIYKVILDHQMYECT